MILDYLLDVEGSINVKISFFLFYQSMRNRPGTVLIRLSARHPRYSRELIMTLFLGMHLSTKDRIVEQLESIVGHVDA
jgi:hypothetical protein